MNRKTHSQATALHEAAYALQKLLSRGSISSVCRWKLTANSVSSSRSITRLNERAGLDWSSNKGAARKFVNDHWGKVENLFHRQHPTIDDALAVANCVAFRPVPRRRSGGGRNNLSKLGFRFDVASNVENQNNAASAGRSVVATEETTASNELNIALQRPVCVSMPCERCPNDATNDRSLYYRTADISGNRFVRWMSEKGFVLDGAQGGVYIGSFIIVLILSILWLWIVVLGMSGATTTIGFLKIALTGALSVFILHALAGWQMRLSMNRITMAPLIVQPWNKGGDFLLELRRDETTKKNAICMVRYVADCPVCDEHGRNAIHVDSGRMEFFGRLVGRCRNAPNEHVWSFDHVSKRGKPLR